MGEFATASTDWTPSAPLVQAVKLLLAPWRWLTSPQYYGATRVPADRPVMFVSNHTLMGVLDTPLLFQGIVEQTGHYPRSMGDHFHFAVPGWRDLLTHLGAVPGTRDNCRRIMAQGHSLMIFPGGGREVFKRKGEAYRLLWGKRAGFARLALEFGYPIVPVASVGAEECYRILVDHDDWLRTPFGPEIAKRSPRKDVAFLPLGAYDH